MVAGWSCGFGKQGDGPTTLPAPVSGDVPMYMAWPSALEASLAHCCAKRSSYEEPHGSLRKEGRTLERTSPPP